MFHAVDFHVRMRGVYPGQNNEETNRGYGDVDPEKDDVDTMDCESDKRESEGDDRCRKGADGCGEEQAVDTSGATAET